MWSQFILENVHFALHLFFALVVFAVAWLYFDATRTRPSLSNRLLTLGYLILSLTFALTSTHLETTILQPLPLLVSLYSAADYTLLAGYALVILGLLVDPLVRRPKVLSTAGLFFLGSASMIFLQPILAVIVGWLYLRRATIGLENHLKPVALAFFLIALSNLAGTTQALRNSSSISLYQLAAPFGSFWTAAHGLLLIAALVLARWVFGYLLKQFQTQLFMITNCLIVAIFLITSLSFSALLLENIRAATLRQTTADAAVLAYAIDSTKAEVASDTTVIAQDPAVTAAIDPLDKPALFTAVQNTLLAKKYSSLVIVDKSGRVIARGEEKEKTGDSLSDSPLVKRALAGETLTTITTRDGISAPEVSIVSGVPVNKNGVVIGAVISGTVLGDAFVDGVKKASGLDVTIYGGSQISATTFTAADGLSRPYGIKETEEAVTNAVLKNNQPYDGSSNILGKTYLASYLPMADADNIPVGMLFVGEPEASSLSTAGRSIEATFAVTALLLVFAIFPSYFIARSLTRQIK
jgi:hypothetical protein